VKSQDVPTPSVMRFGGFDSGGEVAAAHLSRRGSTCHQRHDLGLADLQTLDGGLLLRAFLHEPTASVVAMCVAWYCGPAPMPPQPHFESPVAHTLKMKGLGGF
jgi:hypothetical protein